MKKMALYIFQAEDCNAIQETENKTISFEHPGQPFEIYDTSDTDLIRTRPLSVLFYFVPDRILTVKLARLGLTHVANKQNTCL